MKILFTSNAPWVASGYGQQSKLLVEILKQKGHEIIFNCNFGFLGQIEKDGVLYISDRDYGNPNIQNYVKHFKPDTMITLSDWLVLNPSQWKNFDCPWYSWTPIDVELANGKNQVFFQLFKDFIETSKIVTMSEFGSKQVQTFKKAPAAKIYHIVDTNIFKPMDKESVRNKFIPNAKDYDLIIGMVSGNYEDIMNRKAFSFQFEGLKRFAENNPSLKILFYLHNNVTPSLGGYDLLKLIDNIGLNKSVDVMHTPTFKVIEMPFIQEELAELYNCFDILLNASKSEGFGLPIVEAQACGIPVLTHKFSAMPELTRYGYSVKSTKDKLSTFQKAKAYCDDCGVYGEANFLVGRAQEPDIDDIVSGIQYIFDNINEKDASLANQWVKETFNSEIIGDSWNNLIQGNVAERPKAKVC